MLVLSRNANEAVVVNGGAKCGGLTVRVVEVRDGKVRLGFEAARDVRIHREEVQDDIDAHGRKK